MIPQVLLELLAQSPSMQAAMKAGRKAEISAVVFKACGACEPCTLRARAQALNALITPCDAVGPCQAPREVRYLGTVSLSEVAWRAHLPRWLRLIAARWGPQPTPTRPGQAQFETRGPGQIVVRFVMPDGREIERASY